ncbi:MAG: hypothetical protein MJ223_01255 [Mycoplasmoidaceae bacterium]|nr:hypothetical protein [Mycoplasmoidaceae bacterium]
MAINFDTLKTSEENLQNMFLKFFDHVIVSQQYLLNEFKKAKSLSKDKYEHILDAEKKANQYEAQILDETSWIISKDMPRAAHLRYLIAIIRSIKDLERMADFVERISTILYLHKNIDKPIHDIICQLMSASHNFSTKIYEALSNKDKQTSQYYEKVSAALFADFTKKYRQSFNEIGKIIFKNDIDAKEKFAIFNAIKYLERNADHALNILESFVYINQPNFYFKKESRKY